MKKIREALEFNENLQQFHYNTICNGVANSELGSNGYQTLIVLKNIKECSLFAGYLQRHIDNFGKISYEQARRIVFNLIDILCYIDSYNIKLDYNYQISFLEN